MGIRGWSLRVENNRIYCGESPKEIPAFGDFYQKRTPFLLIYLVGEKNTFKILFALEAQVLDICHASMCPVYRSLINRLEYLSREWLRQR